MPLLVHFIVFCICLILLKTTLFCSIINLVYRYYMLTYKFNLLMGCFSIHGIYSALLLVVKQVNTFKGSPHISLH